MIHTYMKERQRLLLDNRKLFSNTLKVVTNIRIHAGYILTIILKRGKEKRIKERQEGGMERKGKEGTRERGGRLTTKE